MKPLKHLLLSVCVAAGAHSALALNYSSTDLLLVFRQDSQKNVLFDVGSVSNLLSLAAGARVPLPFNLQTVQTNFNNSLVGVKFGVLAATSQLDPAPRVWLTDASVYSGAADVTVSKFSQLASKIDSVGVNAAIYTVSNVAPYIVSAAASSSYDYLVTYGSFSAVSTLAGDSPTAVGGLSPLPVDAASPTTVALYQVQVSTSNPKPAASLVGSFTLDVNGTLTFTAKALPVLSPATISAFDQDSVNEMATISFGTTPGMNYQLLYSTSLDGGWTPVPGAGTAYGDGTLQSLIDYSAADPARFYRIQTTY